jgi:hypothetical protein
VYIIFMVGRAAARFTGTKVSFFQRFSNLHDFETFLKLYFVSRNRGSISWACSLDDLSTIKMFARSLSFRLACVYKSNSGRPPRQKQEISDGRDVSSCKITLYSSTSHLTPNICTCMLGSVSFATTDRQPRTAHARVQREKEVFVLIRASARTSAMVLLLFSFRCSELMLS